MAAVSDGQDAYTVEVTVPVLDGTDAAAFVELVAAESGRIGALLAGQLPHSFVEAVSIAPVADRAIEDGARWVRRTLGVAGPSAQR